MNITPVELIRRGYKRRPDFIRGNIIDAYEKEQHVLYLKGSAWFLQPDIKYPSIRRGSIVTFEDLAFILWESSK